MTLTPQTLIALGIAVTTAFIVQGWILWRLLGAVSVVQRLDDKLSHFGDALTLLTETTEGGFRAVASELDRTVAQTSKAGGGAAHLGAKKVVLPRPTSARMTAAVKRGRSVEEIAATEQVSEGEVRLRLHLAKQAAQAKATATRTRRGRAESTQTQESPNGALRA
jgi:hypothetical protein